LVPRFFNPAPGFVHVVVADFVKPVALQLQPESPQGGIAVVTSVDTHSPQTNFFIVLVVSQLQSQLRQFARLHIVPLVVYAPVPEFIQPRTLMSACSRPGPDPRLV
jgi:hypothetical protein